MHDLRRILASREALYAQADAVLDTSGLTVAQSLDSLRDLLARAEASDSGPRRAHGRR
jgi:XRE family aerobic/anaerobic benzoate catabolism transcriptional regulator